MAITAEEYMKRLYDNDNIDELTDKIYNYISECYDEDSATTLGFASAAYYLGFATRQTLNDYAKRDDATSLPIKRLMLLIESDYEAQLRKQSCTGAIFALKNRGWSDKQEIEHSGSVIYLPPGSDAEGF